MNSSPQKAKTIMELIDNWYNESSNEEFSNYEDDLKSFLLEKKKELEEEQRVTQLQIDNPEMSDVDESDLKADRAIIYHQIQLINSIWGVELK